MNSLYEIDSDSDSNDSDDTGQINKRENSSDEEIENEFNAFFKSRPNYKPKANKKELADDFESEMNQEIVKVIKQSHDECKSILKGEKDQAPEAKIVEKEYEEEEDTDSEAELETGKK